MKQKTSTSRSARATPKRRAEVINAAARVFHAKGYEATTIQDIADELGILKGSVYYYITSKEDVLFEVLEDIHQSALKAVVDATEIEAGPLDRIHAFVDTLSRFNADNRVRMGILLHDFGSLGVRRRKEIVRERDRYDQMLREMIDAGQEARVICADLDRKVAALAIMGMINTIYQWYRPSGGMSTRYIGSIYADLAVRALACNGDTHTPGHLSDGWKEFG